MRRFVSFVLPVLLAVCATPDVLAAQWEAPPGIWIAAPQHNSTWPVLNPKIRVEYDMGSCLDDGSGLCDPDTGTLLIRRGLTNITGSFTVTAWSAQNGTGDYGNVNLVANSWNTIWARICNGYELCATAQISVYADADQVPEVITTQHPRVYDPGACAAVPAVPGGVIACDALVLSYGIPGYVSLDAARAAGVVYSSRSAVAALGVPVTVSIPWHANASTVQAWFSGGGSTYWNGADWDGANGVFARRIVLTKAESTAVGGYIGRQLLSVTARANTGGGVYDGTVVDSVSYYFERDSLTTPIARGWGIAGLSRIYGIAGHNPAATAPSGDVLLVQGGGGVAFYQYESTAGDTISYARPAGMFATLKQSASTERWLLVGIDGTRQYYSWVATLGYARLDSLVTPAGKTAIAYRSSGSGSPTTITDPAGKQIRFDYFAGSGVGKLQRICAPAGANERCTSFYYGTPGGNTVVDSIVDPDGGKTVFGYSGGPHWSAVTAITPRALGTYTIAWHGAIPRPSGVVQPSSSDTVTYLAPQLAGAALVGGTSGNPAASAPDTAWGWVRPPLGPSSYFAANGLGSVTWSRGADDTLSRVERNAAGQVTATWHEGQYLAHWTYNAMGAVATFRLEGGDTSFVTYSGACASGTGYPCLPAQRIVRNTPLPPDTTQWFYGSDLLVDSMYGSDGPLVGNPKGGGFGLTRLWYGANARVDSVLDPQGHRRRFQYEGTWGNLSVAIGDSVTLTCTPSCTTALDTTMIGHDPATGRIVWTRRGNAGRKVTVFRDLIGRDTIVIDSAEGGGSAITTKTRINESARTVTVIDGNGAEFASLLDARGRVIRATDPAGARDTFAYDANDRVTSWTTRRNQTITYAYDALGRLDEKVVPGTGGGTWTYGYHATLGTLDTLVSPGASVYRVHNALGFLTEEKTVVNGVTRVVKYAYSPQGTLDTLTDPWGDKYAFGWDVTNRARTITNPFSETFSIRHTTEGLLSQVVFPTGSDQVTYDRAHLVRTAGLSGEITYARDAVTKGLSEVTWGGVKQVFGYDAFGRLAKDSVSTTGYGPVAEDFTYDAAGNRTGGGGTFTYGLTNALLGRPTGLSEADPGDTLTYDAAGNAIWWKNKTTGAYDSLTWDAENRLVRLRRYDSSGTLSRDVQYAYDGFGRRVKHWGVFVWDHLNVWNGWELLAQTSLSGDPVRRYTHHPEGIDFPLAMREGSSTYFFHLDGQGNVYLVTDTAGTPWSEYRYRGWGDRYPITETWEYWTPFTFKAREEDVESGLIYMRHRYYSPRLERFLNEDPIGIAGGLNVYGFTGGDPVNRSDRFGLHPQDPPPPCSKVAYYVNDVWNHTDYNFDGCWVFDLLAAMTGIQFGYRTIGGGGPDAGGGGGIPAGGVPTASGRGSTTDGSRTREAEQGEARDWVQCIVKDPGVQWGWERRDWLIGAAAAAVFRKGVLSIMDVRGRQLRNFKGRPGFGRSMIDVGKGIAGFFLLPAKVGAAAAALYVTGVAIGCAAASL